MHAFREEITMDPRIKTTRTEREDSPAPDDPRPEWAEEDIEIEDRKPDLGEIEEDTSEID
jgi:hypothetical protein